MLPLPLYMTVFTIISLSGWEGTAKEISMRHMATVMYMEHEPPCGPGGFTSVLEGKRAREH